MEDLKKLQKVEKMPLFCCSGEVFILLIDELVPNSFPLKLFLQAIK